MVQQDHFPIEVDSFQVLSAQTTSPVELPRKRKLLAEQLGGLPMPKHKSWNRCQCHASEVVLSLGQKPEIEDLGLHLNRGKSVVPLDSLNPESATDSNSLTADDSAMPVNSAANVELVSQKTYSCDTPSTSSANSGVYRSSDGDNPLDAMAGTATRAVEQGQAAPLVDELHNPFLSCDKMDASQSLEEHLLEFGELEYVCQEYMSCGIHPFADKEIIKGLYSNEGNLENVLSAETWGNNQEMPLAVRKPTIDQEFEEYFSSLML